MTTRQHPERDEQAAIVKLLKLIGASVYVLGTTRRKGDYQGTMQTPGIPDLYVIMPAPLSPAILPGLVRQHVWIEVKAPKGRLSAAQQRFADACLEDGRLHLVGGIDVVTDWLRQGGWIK